MLARLGSGPTAAQSAGGQMLEGKKKSRAEMQVSRSAIASWLSHAATRDMKAFWIPDCGEEFKAAGFWSILFYLLCLPYSR